MRIQASNLGQNEKVPYAKADIVKVCRVGANFAVSFYQLDYQDVAIKAELHNQSQQNSNLKPIEETPLEMQPIIVGKIVMDANTFLQFKTDLEEVYKKSGVFK